MDTQQGDLQHGAVDLARGQSFPHEPAGLRTRSVSGILGSIAGITPGRPQREREPVTDCFDNTVFQIFPDGDALRNASKHPGTDNQ